MQRGGKSRAGVQSCVSSVPAVAPELFDWDAPRARVGPQLCLDIGRVISYL